MTRLRSHLTQGHSVHSEISPAPRTPSPSLESIVPKSVVNICTQHFIASRFTLAPLASCADHFAVYALQTRLLFLVFGLPQPTLQRHSFLCDSSDTHQICFPEVHQLHLTFPLSLATIDIRSVPSRTPLALCVQPCAFMHTSGTLRATLCFHAHLWHLACDFGASHTTLVGS